MISYSMTLLTEGKNIELDFLIIAFIVVIFLCLLATINTPQRDCLWHSAHSNFVPYGLTGSASLRMPMALYLTSFAVELFTFFAGIIFLSPCSTFVCLISFALSTSIFISKSFPSFSFRLGMFFKPIIALFNLFCSDITRGTKSFCLVFSCSITSFTYNKFGHMKLYHDLGVQ